MKAIRNTIFVFIAAFGLTACSLTEALKDRVSAAAEVEKIIRELPPESRPEARVIAIATHIKEAEEEWSSVHALGLTSPSQYQSGKDIFDRAREAARSAGVAVSLGEDPEALFEQLEGLLEEIILQQLMAEGIG